MSKPANAFELAQFNVAHMNAPIDSPVMHEFVMNLKRINALADAAPGFVWRMQTDHGDATEFRPMGETTLVNLSVWADSISLKDYVYKSDHVEFISARKKWFTPMREPHMVLWWVPNGHRPTMEEAMERLTHLRAHGPTAHAFTFSADFPRPVAEQTPGAHA